MDTPKVFESEYRFCLILWEHEPIKSSELVNLCKEQLGWKPTTTYTVIKRLSERGVLKNENTIVSSLVSKDEVQASEINEMVEKTFEGSLPAFPVLHLTDPWTYWLTESFPTSLHHPPEGLHLHRILPPTLPQS